MRIGSALLRWLAIGCLVTSGATAVGVIVTVIVALFVMPRNTTNTAHWSEFVHLARLRGAAILVASLVLGTICFLFSKSELDKIWLRVIIVSLCGIIVLFYLTF